LDIKLILNKLIKLNLKLFLRFTYKFKIFNSQILKIMNQQIHMKIIQILISKSKIKKKMNNYIFSKKIHKVKKKIKNKIDKI
jgi:hypothetical protein